jgi:hypothetical protein
MAMITENQTKSKKTRTTPKDENQKYGDCSQTLSF